MTLLQVLLVIGVVWVVAAVGLALLIGATVKDPDWIADDEEDWGWPHRIDQRRD